MLYFPHPLQDNEDGLIAIGGDLSTQRLLLAYQYGIFPWYEQAPILWWWTHPRCILIPGKMKVSKSLNQFLRKTRWTTSINQDFNSVIEKCATTNRKGQKGTWINPDMIEAYKKLHQLGYAHSVEVWQEDEIIGGLYGVAIGKIFFGESMFSLESNASKVALFSLSQLLFVQNCRLIDCQQQTDHLISLGAELMPKDQFWNEIRQNILLEETPSENENQFWKNHVRSRISTK